MKELLNKSIIILVVFMSTNAFAWHLKPEKAYQKEWCNGKGITEFILIDNTRIDCLTDEYAIEFDFARKWYEAIGQSLHYAKLTGKKAGIALIIEKQSDLKYYERMVETIEFFQLPITFWKIEGVNK